MNNTGNKSQTVLWILGLHRSGTTVVWNAFRSNRKFMCFDEPFTHDLGNCFPRNNHKRTYDEYLHLYGNDPGKFWALYNPVNSLEELDSEFTVQQRKYLSSLLGHSNNTAIDETHLHSHLPAIQNLAPSGYVIHLYRRSRSFATSHLRPDWARSGTLPRQFFRLLRHVYNSSIFWDRRDFIPALRRGDVIGSHHQSKFGLMLTEAGYDAERIMSAPALVRLLAYWHYQYHYLEKEGPRLFKERFISLRYEDFASRPAETMAALYSWLGMTPPPDVEYHDVYPPKPPYKPDDRRWTEAAKLAGFSDEELVTLL